MNKLFSYGVMILGVAIIAVPIVPGLNLLIKNLPIPPWSIIVAGLVVLALGLVMMKPLSSSSSSKQVSEEVPIYHGNKIVGYRRAHR